MSTYDSAPSPEKTPAEIDAEVAAIMGGNAASAAILDIDPTDKVALDTPDHTEGANFVPPQLQDYVPLLSPETPVTEVPDVTAMDSADIWAQLDPNSDESKQ